MQGKEIDGLVTAIAALEGQRATLGDAVVDLAVAPLRARLASLQRVGGLQRRQATVLFADVVGSTAMAGAMDAEDTLDVLSGTLRRMAAIVEAHQGRVLRFTGDGVKAAFGMDEAREDDPDRAVRAGLAILQAGREQAEAARRLHGLTDFAVRVGVHTGDVALGAGVEADNTAMGAAVNIAARMEQSAPPGGLRISHDTWNHVRGLFDVEPQLPLLVKGVEAPMQTYLVRAVRDRGFAGVERGLQGLAIPMVGRDGELRRLRLAVDQARDTGQLQVVTLVGEAGLGKSRLLREWMAGLQSCRVITVRSQPDAMLRPAGLLRSVLSGQFGVADTDSAEVARAKVVDGLAPWFEERSEQRAQLIGQLSGLDFGESVHVRGLDPQMLRDLAFAAFCAWLQALAAAGRPLPVLIVEDLHWADDSSLDLLQHLLSNGAGLPLALVMTCRPALLTRRPDWSAPETHVHLKPLATDDGDELARALLQRIDDVPRQLKALIVERADGNPYYMEELTRRLIDDGVIVVSEPHWSVHIERLEPLGLPGTLVGLLQTRLDALPAAERQAARRASIIGHVFWDDALHALDANAPQALPALQRAAIVKSHETSDFEGTTERQFDHQLLHQVTYDTMLKAERRLGHGAAARWLAERTKGRGAEFLAMTGEHAERAGETALAVDCFEQAGEEAKARFANTAAIAWTRRALHLLGEAEPLRRFDLLARLERVANATGDRSGQVALLAEMSALLERHPDDTCQARWCMSSAKLADIRSDMDTAEQLGRLTFELAVRCGAAEAAAESQALLGWIHTKRHPNQEASPCIAVGLQWAGRIPAERNRAKVEAQLLALLGIVALNLDRFDESGSALRAALSRGEALAAPRVQINALANLSDRAKRLGHWQEAIGWCEQMRSVGSAAGVQSAVAWSLYMLGRIATATGDHPTALHAFDGALATFVTIGDRRMEAHVMHSLAALHLARDDAAASSGCCAAATLLFQVWTDRIGVCEVTAYAARCELSLGRPDAALAAVNQLLEQLAGDPATFPRDRTIEARWTCQQVLAELRDARADGLLDQLHADVLEAAARMTGAEDRERLIQALPEFRAVVAAHARRSQDGSGQVADIPGAHSRLSRP